MTHWAVSYIGKPWAADGDGPARFSCWGLVRHVFREHHGIDFPPIAINDQGRVDDEVLDNVAAIKQAARVSGMRPLTRSALHPRDGDIVLMRSQVRLHCGIVVYANGRIGVLHSMHAFGVVWQPWREAIEGMTPELWRRT